jgi:hypothetical protein
MPAQGVFKAGDVGRSTRKRQALSLGGNEIVGKWTSFLMNGIPGGREVRANGTLGTPYRVPPKRQDPTNAPSL